MKRIHLLCGIFFILPFFSTFASDITFRQDNVLNIASKYIGTPYVPHTLEYGDTEKLVVNKKQVDCTTFVEYVIAEVLHNCDTLGNFTEQEYLQKIRYRDGLIDGYPSRLHYISEWINEGVKNNFFTDQTKLHGVDSMYIALSYMSKHPQYYKHLSRSRKNQKAIFETEKKLSGEIVRWVPKDSIPPEGLDWIVDGDIIALTVGIYGLDVSHLGFAVYQGDKLHLLHASSSKGEVIIEPIPLSLMLKRNKNWTGIRVVRVSDRTGSAADTE